MSEDNSRKGRRQRFRRIDELFNELEPLAPSAREERLAELERSAPELFPDLRELLEENASTLVRGLEGLSERVEREPRADPVEPGRPIGPYRLVRRLGSGGMGEVWEARQDEPIRRRVALKILRPDKTTPALEARFRSEQQALAMMDHPHIASAYENGTTDAGAPWFAMEYIEGTPLNRYCDEHLLSLDARLDLFCQLCAAVQHAHRRGVVHRDLKPANVLVTMDDEPTGASATPQLKVIDFGIAKSLDLDLLGDNQTLVGDLVGTPEYMSPEQAGHEDGVIDTRTDVYALGVLLFELLAGGVPIPGAVLRRAGVEEMRRIIRELEAPKPSVRLADARPEATTDIATRRSTDAPSLLRRVRGDLDWIVLKALSKSKANRYETPLALSDDLRRFLSGDPVLAGPPTWTYRASKWIRKHRAAATTAALVLLLAASSVAAVTAALLRARAAERAMQEEVEQERATRRFLIELFEANDPYADTPWQGGVDPTPLTGIELVDRGAERLLDGAITDPSTRSRLQVTVAELYTKLARPDAAEPLLRSAVELGGASAAADPLDAARTRSLAAIGLAEVHATRGELEAAVAQYGEAVEGAGDYDLLRARALTGRANVLRALVRIEDAKVDALSAIELARAAADRDPFEARDVLHLALAVLADVYVAEGDIDAAVETLQTLRETQEAEFGADHPRLAAVWRGLSDAYDKGGRYVEGGAAAERALQISRATLGDQHPLVAFDLTQVAESYRHRGQWGEALPLLQEADEVLRQTGADGTTRAITLAEIGMCLEELQRPEESAQAHREALELWEQHYGPDHPEIAPALARLSSALRAAGRPEESLVHAERALDVAQAATPEGDWRHVVAGAEVSQTLAALGSFDEAADAAATATAIARDLLGETHPMHGALQTIQATALIELGRRDRDESALDQAGALLTGARAIFEQPDSNQPVVLAEITRIEGLLADARAGLSPD